MVEPASQRDAARLAQLHGASFHRGWGEGEFESMLGESNTLAHRLKLGRKIIVLVFVFIESGRQQGGGNIAIDGDRLGPAAVV